MKHFTFLVLCLGLTLWMLCSLNAPAQVREKSVLSFNYHDGSFPAGVSIDPSGNLWVVATNGGTGSGCGKWGCGTILELVPVSGALSPKVIYDFRGSINGAYPNTNLVFDREGNVYGTTLGGGSPACGCGTVFKLTPGWGGWTEKTIYRFHDTGKHNDGAFPYSGLVMDAAGNLYGTTVNGGPYFGLGTVYELTPNAHGNWTERVLWNFWTVAGTQDGYEPYARLVIDGQGNLYGTTNAGGTGQSCGGATGCGTVFELAPGANGIWTEKVIHNFQGGSDGSRPQAELALDASGHLYGTTTEGGGAGCDNGIGCGTVFVLSPGINGGWSEKVLHIFSDSGTDGSVPGGGLVFDSSGNLEGVTSYGGAFNWGTVFRLTPNRWGNWPETQLYSFDNPKGVVPNSTLAVDADGNFYGTLLTGGRQTTLCTQTFLGCGVLFEITP